MDTITPIRLEKGDNLIHFKWDISRLVPGKYILDIALVARNSWGNYQVIDSVPEAYCFEITAESDNQQIIAWNPRNYGYYIGAEIEIC